MDINTEVESGLGNLGAFHHERWMDSNTEVDFEFSSLGVPNSIFVLVGRNQAQDCGHTGRRSCPFTNSVFSKK